MRSLRWWWALPAAAAGGYLLDVATPSLNWWPAAFAGTALVLAAVWQQRLGLALLAGAVGGAAFWLPHISWLTLYLGPVPWLGLGAVMIAWFALFGAAAALATRGIARLRPPRWVLLTGQSLAVAGLWVLREQVQSVWPYGGFAWGRLAHTQAEGPLAALVSWLGFSGLSGVIALACAVPVAVAFAARRPFRALPPAAVATAAALALLAVVPVAQLPQTGTLRVAAVQGDSKSGIFDDRENGDVFRAHLQATEALLDELEAAGEPVDVIVWPENSAEFMLPAQTFRLLAVQRLAERAGTPIVLGTILEEAGTDGDPIYTNSTIVIDADGVSADSGRYDKRRPVPFAEYMPNRDFFHALAPDLVDLVQLEYTAGALPSVLDVDGASGLFRAGIAICFDIVFDDQAVAMATDQPLGSANGAGAAGSGAQVIFAQTNNADFGRTDESAQQLQIARLRAIESGRALVNISTVGTSAIVLPDGSDADRLTPFTVGAMTAEVPLVDGLTPALRFGAWIAACWMLLGGAGAMLGAVVMIGAVRGRSAR